jgi:non-ribosomal peptide synthetase component F
VISETGVTLFMILLAAYNILLSRWTGMDDILIGSPAAAKTHADLQNIIGMFVNMLALRNFPQKHKSFREFLMEVKKNSINAYENQDYQYDQLVEEMGLDRSPTGKKLINTVFTLQNTSTIEINRLGIDGSRGDFKEDQHEIRTLKFDLTLDAYEINDYIYMWFSYSPARFKKTTIARLKKYYPGILEQVVINIDVKLKDIKVAGELMAARSNLLQEDQGMFAFQ